jgi:hypothetical protein
MSLDIFNGIPVRVHNFPPSVEADLTRPRRTHRKRRIQKKWIKRYGYRTKTVDMPSFMVGGTLYVSHRQFDQLKKKSLNAETGKERP